MHLGSKHIVRINPDLPCPPDILRKQIGIEVKYFDFSKKEQTGIIEIDRSIELEIKKFFYIAHKLKFPINKVCPSSSSPYFWDDEKLMGANITSGFNYRLSEVSGKVSEHGKGLAIDVNTVQNPFIYFKGDKKVVSPSRSKWDPRVPGTLHKDHELVNLMISMGWYWGGDLTLENDNSIDYQHFQKRPYVKKN